MEPSDDDAYRIFALACDLTGSEREALLVEEVAAALDVAPTTVKVDWRFARAWLQRASDR